MQKTCWDVKSNSFRLVPPLNLVQAPLERVLHLRSLSFSSIPFANMSDATASPAPLLLMSRSNVFVLFCFFLSTFGGPWQPVSSTHPRPFCVYLSFPSLSSSSWCSEGRGGEGGVRSGLRPSSIPPSPCCRFPERFPQQVAKKTPELCDIDSDQVETGGFDPAFYGTAAVSVRLSFFLAFCV